MRCAILLTTKSNSILFLCFSLFRQLRSCHLDQLCKMPEIVQVKDSSEECNKMENALEALNEVLKLKMKSVVQDLEIKQLKGILHLPLI